MRGSLRLVLVCGACVLAPVGAASAATVGPTAVGAARLGLTQQGYERALHAVPFLTRYADGSQRLWFTRAAVSVLLGRDGRGSVVSTSAPTYRLAGGSGPCAPFDALAGHDSLTKVALPAGLRTGLTVYRSGRIWLTVTASGRIGRVAVARGRPSVVTLVSDSQCGLNEQGAAG